MSWQESYLARFYSRDRGWVDGTTEFHRFCSCRIGSSARILEIGAGPSNETSRFLAGLGRLEGLDIDLTVESNDALAEARVFDGTTFPLEDQSFDACVSDYVIEHVLDPATHLREVRRILCPGGCYLFRTPNLCHYVPLVAWLTPHTFHGLVANRLRRLPPEVHTPYPTVYAMNTRRAIRRHAGRSGLCVEELRLIEKEPMYGLVSRLLFLTFLAYERIANATERAAFLRSTILGSLRRQ